MFLHKIIELIVEKKLIMHYVKWEGVWKTIFQIKVLFTISFVWKKKNLCSTNIYFKMSSFKMEILKLM
jgi:hypothetical protein